MCYMGKMTGEYYGACVSQIEGGDIPSSLVGKENASPSAADQIFQRPSNSARSNRRAGFLAPSIAAEPVSACRIAATERSKRPIEDLRGHAAVPYLRPPRLSTTSFGAEIALNRKNPVNR